MRMRAFKSHGMNRVIARGISHAVNDHYRHNRSNYNTSSSSDASLGVMFFFLLILLAACGAM
jgi:hypothetical protein